MLPQSYSTKPSRRTRRVPAPTLRRSRSTALKDPSFWMTVRKTLAGASSNASRRSIARARTRP